MIASRVTSRYSFDGSFRTSWPGVYVRHTARCIRYGNILQWRAHMKSFGATILVHPRAWQ